MHTKVISKMVVFTTGHIDKSLNDAFDHDFKNFYPFSDKNLKQYTVSLMSFFMLQMISGWKVYFGVICIEH